MELRPSSRMNRIAALAACENYLNQLPLSLEIRRSLLRTVAEVVPESTADALTTLHALLSGGAGDHENPAAASVDLRLKLAYGRAGDSQPPPLPVAPPLHRTSMAPTDWPPRLLVRWMHALKLRAPSGRLPHAAASCESSPPAPPSGWQRTGNTRRSILLGLVLAQTGLATHFMSAVLPYHGSQPLETAMLILFALLCGWVSAGFWTAIMGFLVLLSGKDRHAISGKLDGSTTRLDGSARTAIVMPICNEHVARVFAGLGATYESLARTGNLQHFDFFILSDSSDPDIRVAEAEAWQSLCRRIDGFGRIFYRWRQHRIKRKSGNIADFCRRWGSDYRYMVVLDADSVMTGDCLSSLVRLMEDNPGAGIIQTAPSASGRDTLYARLQQFASRIYGPLFVAGLHFWQLGESHYWGHNAIIRIAPFMRHCALGRLPGKGSLSGEILSHDFVEAALMRRAGWGVWIAYDLPGSFEEMPPNLVDELQRDRRWCHGNLMNFRLFLAPGFHMAHRAVFVTGVVAYVSAFLWFLFLLLSTWLLAQHTLMEPQYFTQPKQLFPLWPEWHPDQAIALFGVTATWLFLPKLLSVVLIARTRTEARFGGFIRLLAGMLAEWISSMLLAPIRMLFHTQFVLAAVAGWSIQWQSPPREDAATDWRTALRRHGWHTLAGCVWGAGVYWLNPSFLWWMLPVIGALVLSIPISVYSSSTAIGRLARRYGLFLTPEETTMPLELRHVAEEMAYVHTPPDFAEAVTDPSLNALICALGVTRSRSDTAERLRLEREGMLLRSGPDALSPREKMALLNDPKAMARLHFGVWASAEVHHGWFGKTTRATHLRHGLPPLAHSVVAV